MELQELNLEYPFGFLTGSWTLFDPTTASICLQVNKFLNWSHEDVFCCLGLDLGLGFGLVLGFCWCWFLLLLVCFVGCIFWVSEDDGKVRSAMKRKV
ncbi:hypothetical protein Hanom_Chr14g01252321 [Helianthus anomalus]